MQAGPQVDGNRSRPMNNTLMSSLPITAKLTLCAKGNVEGEGGLWGKRTKREEGGQQMGEEGVRKLLLTPAGTL